MDRTYDFDAFSLDVKLTGQLGEQPVFYIEIHAPSESILPAAVSRPLPSEAALYAIKEMRKVLRMGPERHAQLRQFKEKRSAKESRETLEASRALHETARSIEGGDSVLAQAENQIEAEYKKEKADYLAAMSEERQANRVEFNLETIVIMVQAAGETPDGKIVFRLELKIPSWVPHHVQVLSDTPLMSYAAGWILDEMEMLLNVGLERYVEKETKESGRPEESMEYAAGLHEIAKRLGNAGIARAKKVLEVAIRDEEEDLKQAELEELESALSEVRRVLKNLRKERAEL